MGFRRERRERVQEMLLHAIWQCYECFSFISPLHLLIVNYAMSFEALNAYFTLLLCIFW
jgi:hypothetical protein